jgi:hypothetical protein
MVSAPGERNDWYVWKAASFVSKASVTLYQNFLLSGLVAGQPPMYAP